MAELTLPAVASKFHTFCKKCDSDRYHVVLTHPTSSSAKLQCEVCKAKSTYKLPKAGAVPGAKKLTGAAAKRKEASQTAKKNAHNTEYNQLLEASKTTDAQKYNMKLKFAVNQQIDHPKFGVGVIRSAQHDKIEVVFPDEVRMLVHNRQ